MDKQQVVAIPVYDDIERELLPYLSLRFASIEFAQRIISETRSRILEADILMLVGDPRTYVCSFAITVGKRLLQDASNPNGF